MYLPRPLLPSLYTTLLQTTHPSSAPLLLLVAATVDALCAARILTAQLRRDFVPHKLRCVTGYADLQRAGEEEVKGLRRDGENGGQGGVVVCLGCGGGVDLADLLGLTGEEEEEEGVVGGEDGHGVEVWVIDSHRSWNLENVFAGSARGVVEGKLNAGYRTASGAGGVIVWDEGEIESELGEEREAWFALQDMPEITEEDMALAEGEDSEEEEEEEGEGDAEGGAEQDEVPSSSQTRKRKASSEDDEDDDMEFSSDRPPARRRRSNSNSSIPIDQPPPSSQPTGSPGGAVIPSSPPKQKRVSQKQLRRQLLQLRKKHEKTLEAYYDRGSWTGEPCSSILYSLVSELGREDNELLWLAVVGVESVVLSPFTTSTSLTNTESRSSGGRRRQPSKLELVKAVLRDEVRRLNPPDLNHRRGASGSVVGGNAAGYDDVPTTARSATDTSIRLSPEPRFLLIRHWSLLDSMLHTTYLATRLHLWNEQGRKRLNKLLAKMGISLQEAGKGYLHLDLEVKRTLRARVGKFAEQYGLEGLVPEGDGGGVTGRGEGFGFVRSWGWRGTLSAGDVVSVVSAILEVGAVGQQGDGEGVMLGSRDGGGGEGRVSYGQRVQGLPSPPHSSDDGEGGGSGGAGEGGDWATERFFAAYDALSPTSSSPSTSHSSNSSGLVGARLPNQQGLPALLAGIPVAQGLARAILRTGSALISKNQIRHLRSFRLGVVKEGPDVVTFRHPGALVKLAGWVGEAVGVLEGEKTGWARGEGGDKGVGNEGEGALVLGCLDEGRGVYVVVGLSSGSMGGVGGKGGKTKKEKEEAAASKKRRLAERTAKKAERRREKAEEKKRKGERDAANGLLDSDDEGEESDATESSESSNSSDSDSDASDDDESGVVAKRKRAGMRNRFGQAFQEVVVETGARVRIDSFEHSVVEVRKEDLAGFLEGLSGRGVVG
ncbi:DNA replication initiation factor cdc45 [Elasticomyces elasticus]|nr:DNA replication initiation factor cdc45 [Elasticomyces elasticus]